MKQRKLGRNGPSVSALGLGCMTMTPVYGAVDDTESVATLNRAVELGVTLFDTANVYGLGQNETFVGEVLRSRRDRIFLSTKCGLTRSADAPLVPTPNGRPEHIRESIDASLKRLGMDHVDIYFLHRVDPKVPVEDSIGAFAEIVRAGKARYIGLSEANADQIRRAHAVHPITALQSEYSLWTRDPEGEVLDTCRELGIGLMPYSPLGRGFLAGAVTDADTLADNDFRKSNPRFQGDNFARNRALLAKLEVIAAEKGITVSQLALAWVLAQGDDVVPIPGTKRRSYLESNIAAADVELTDEDLDAIAALDLGHAVAGERYGSAFSARLKGEARPG